jgi:hypothetical protein
MTTICLELSNESITLLLLGAAISLILQRLVSSILVEVAHFYAEMTGTSVNDQPNVAILITIELVR